MINLAEVEAAARGRLPQAVYDYYAGGAHDEVTLRENVRAYQALALRPRVLVDVSARDLSTTVLGAALSMPVLVAPMAFQRMAHPDGELATARAAAAAGVPMVVSTLSTTSVEDVRGASAGALWFQLYIYRDRGASRAMVERAERLGYGALVLTVDTPVLGRRERDVRNAFRLPPGLRFAHALSDGTDTLPDVPAESGLAALTADALDPSISWRDVEWLRSITRLPLVLKGVVRADDAARAAELGVDGVVVSNHGGRQLDTAVATVRALPAVADAVAGRAAVLVDGGVRRGTDVLKAIALGARAVLLGRPVLWGLAADGERGVAMVLDLLRAELDQAMALCGCPSLAQVTRDLVRDG